MSSPPVRLALIEDHAALREGLQLLLGREGCEVVGTAGDLDGGLALLEETRPDVAVVDVQLGAESGIELARRALRDDPKTAVVLYTGAPDLELLWEGLEAGARGYALKHGPPDELMDAICAVAAGGTYVDPRLRSALESRPPPRRPPRLSRREREVLDLLAQGLTGEQVAEALVLSTETVRTHVRNAMTKLDAHTRVHAITIALREGEISLAAPSAERAP